MQLRRRLVVALVLAMTLVTGSVRLHAQSFTGQVMQLYNLIRTGGISITTSNISTLNVTTRITLGNGTNTIPASQLMFFSVSQDSIFRMVIENRSATANADTEIKLINGTGTAFMGVCNVNNTSCGANTVPGGSHRSWLDISDNTAGVGWDMGFASATGVTRFYTGGYTAANFRLWIEPTVVSLKNGECFGAEAGTAGNDTTLSRSSAGNWVMGNGTCGDTTGSLTVRNFTANNQITLTNALLSNIAPTISSGFGTSPSVPTKNGSGAFTINVGTGGTATNGVIAFNFTAANGFSIKCEDLTTQNATVFVTKQIASSTTTATIANFTTAGAQGAWATGDILSCHAFAL